MKHRGGDRRPTLKDVASTAGVSVMSASYAMRATADESRVSAETRRRVLEVALELNYRPDARARALRLRETKIVGFYTGLTRIDLRNPFFAELVTGLQQGCELVGKSLLLHNFPSSTVFDEVYGELLDGRVDGLIAVLPLKDPLAGRLAAAHLPVVAIADPYPGLPAVVVDDEAGAKAVAYHLADLGHRNVVFASSADLPESAKRRQRSFVEHAVSRGIDVSVWSIGPETSHLDFIARAREVATAIFAWSDSSARRLLEACRASGVDVPRDLAVVGFDGCPTFLEDTFPLTTVRAPWEQVGREAIKVLNRMLRNEPYDLETVMPIEFVRGMTT